MDKYNFISFAGLWVLVALAWLLSAQRRRVNQRCLWIGIALQLLLGLLVFRTPHSKTAFLWINDLVNNVLNAATAGQKFLFGPLAADPAAPGAIGFILAIHALPLIIFVASVMSLLYYWRIMPLIIRAFAWVFARLMRVSGAESLCAAGNIFAGIESATAIRPYLDRMTPSELCTILTAGMATVASSTLGLYVMMLSDVFPTIAGHLISASIISAPAALVMSKLLLPEVDQPETLGHVPPLMRNADTSAIEALVNGAMAGARLVLGVSAMLVALLGLLAVVNLGVAHLGGWFGADVGTPAQWSLERLLGYVFYPLAVVVGIPPADATIAAGMIGERFVLTEIPAYHHLVEAMSTGAFTHPRSPVVTAYALCGFAHVASLAIFVGGVSALAPQRRADLSAVAPRALLAANLACLMTAAVAGTFYHDGTLQLVTNG